LAAYKNIIYYFGLLLLAFFSFLMLRILFIYIPIKTDVGFLQLKQEYIHITEWRIAFFTHVFTSILVLLAGFTQFSKTALKLYPRLHRTLGYLYVINILLITGPAGLLMSFYANGGITSKIGFIVLSVLWIFFTAKALIFAKQKKFLQHKVFMIRSFALTLSAITLRCWKVILVNFTDIPPMDRYRLIAWLGWTLNLLIAEWYIYKFIKQQNKNIT
jgi:hypothetical protein